jgi:hypothetical protein
MLLSLSKKLSKLSNLSREACLNSFPLRGRFLLKQRTGPKGKEANWTQTVPGKGWFVLFRAYGPLEPWFDKTWRPGEPELVK